MAKAAPHSYLQGPTPGGPRFRSNFVQNVTQGSGHWRYSDGKTHEVTTRRVAPTYKPLPADVLRRRVMAGY